MTPDEALSKAMDVIDQHVPLAHYKVPQLAASIALAFRAALRERDAEHEVVLATARAEALGEAVEECDRYIEQLAEAPGAVRGHTAKAEAAKELAGRLRALLEEAGK